jgi:hypothetical protein
MDGEKHSNNHAPYGDAYPLPVSETMPVPLPKESIDSPTPPPIQNNISPELEEPNRQYFRDAVTGEVYVYISGWERGSPEFRKWV